MCSPRARNSRFRVATRRRAIPETHPAGRSAGCRKRVPARTVCRVMAHMARRAAAFVEPTGMVEVYQGEEKHGRRSQGRPERQVLAQADPPAAEAYPREQRRLEDHGFVGPAPRSRVEEADRRHEGRCPGCVGSGGHGERQRRAQSGNGPGPDALARCASPAFHGVEDQGRSERRQARRPRPAST